MRNFILFKMMHNVVMFTIMVVTMFLLGVLGARVSGADALSEPATVVTTGFMGWLAVHWPEILAIWGALCIVARGIVALTPTPKDDEALAKVTLWLKSLRTIFGLDLKQGR